MVEKGAKGLIRVLIVVVELLWPFKKRLRIDVIVNQGFWNVFIPEIALGTSLAEV